MAKPDYLIRMEQERNELSEKVVALTKFILTNPEFDKLPRFEQVLMIVQQSGMSNYLAALEQRINIKNGLGGD